MEIETDKNTGIFLGKGKTSRSFCGILPQKGYIPPPLRPAPTLRSGTFQDPNPMATLIGPIMEIWTKFNQSNFPSQESEVGTLS